MFIDYTLARVCVKRIACNVHHILHHIITARVHVREYTTKNHMSTPNTIM
nr:MAG TPA: hypothetical protein [Siphoviridae sp. ctcOR4]